jgi:asparagine synthase (glutamine-hydrolysing)
MCGISGLITIDNKFNFSYSNDAAQLKNLMKNRGPDNQGSIKIRNKDAILYFFSSRLKIIDLKNDSNQPFVFDDLVLIFNGEIYNYIEIKDFLKTKGISFSTNSDTEVLIKAYKFWGEDCVRHFDGMWSFAIYDKKKNTVFLSRDNFGEKPLYYYKDSKNFIFGSEIKYILFLSKYNLDVKNFEKISTTIACGYKSIFKDKNTFYKNINYLEPGCNIVITFNSDLTVSNKKYFKVSELLRKKISQDVNTNICDIRNLIINSLKIRLRSDVPISFCLSGGLDSASLVSIASKIFNIKPKCFSIIDNDKRYNEINNIKKIQKNLDLDVEYIFLKKESFSNFLSKLQTQISYHDSPISTVSYFIHNKISRRASEQGFKVIFSGTGADEIFSGYLDHHLMYLSHVKNFEFYNSELSKWKKFLKPVIRDKNLKDYKLFYDSPNYRDHIFNDKNFIKNFFIKKLDYNFQEKKYSNSNLKNRMLNELFHETVPVILNEDDLNSMQFSIENRSPFLSKKLIEYTMSINEKNYIRDGYSKYLLRESMRGILDDNIRLNRLKIGFNSSIKSLTNINSKELVSFFSECPFLSELLDFNEINKIPFNKQISNSMNKFLFTLINVKVFLEKKFKT